MLCAALMRWVRVKGGSIAAVAVDKANLKDWHYGAGWGIRSHSMVEGEKCQKSKPKALRSYAT
jgi:hypothetical protein